MDRLIHLNSIVINPTLSFRGAFQSQRLQVSIAVHQPDAFGLSAKLPS
jgi:hypothetical protein